MFSISKKKNSNKILITYETELDIRDLEKSDIYTPGYYYKTVLTDVLQQKAIDIWIEKHGDELFGKFDTDEFLKQYKKEFMRKLIK